MSPASNFARLSHGLKLYSDALRRYIDRRVREDWWDEYVLTSLPGDQIALLDLERRQHAAEIDEEREGVLPKDGVDFLDARHFADVFRERFRANQRTAELMVQAHEAHELWSDPPEGDLHEEDVDLAISAMHEALAYYQLPAATELLALREGGDPPRSGYVELSEEIKQHSDGMRRIFRDWAERESPGEWWEQRVGEQRRAAIERHIEDAEQLPTEELIGLLGPADLTAIALDNCDLSGQERWLLRTVLRVRRSWAHPASGEFPDAYVDESSEWLREALATVADAVEDLLEPEPAEDEAEPAEAADAGDAQPVEEPRRVSVGDYFTCGIAVAFLGAVVVAVVLVVLALLGTRTWPVDRALDASSAVAGTVGDFVDGLTGTAPTDATATPVPTATPTRTATPTATATPSPTPTPTATPTPTPTATPTPTPTATRTPPPSLSLERAIGNTDGDGVSLRDDCDDDARVSAPGEGWPEGQQIEVIEVGSGGCEGWLLAQADGVASWVREAYVVDREQ